MKSPTAKNSVVIIRKVLSVLLFLAAGLYSFFVLAVAQMNMSYRTVPNGLHWIAIISYVAPMLLFPFVMVALIPRRFATVGLWVISAITITLPLFLSTDIRLKLGYPSESRSLFRLFMNAFPLLAIPLATQLAVELRKGTRFVEHAGGDRDLPREKGTV
jgi:hypothetical protein